MTIKTYHIMNTIILHKIVHTHIYIVLLLLVASLRWEGNHHMRAGAYTTTLHRRHECMALTTGDGWMSCRCERVSGVAGSGIIHPLPMELEQMDEAAPARRRPPKRSPGTGRAPRSQPSWNPQSGARDLRCPHGPDGRQGGRTGPSGSGGGGTACRRSRSSCLSPLRLPGTPLGIKSDISRY